MIELSIKDMTQVSGGSAQACAADALDGASGGGFVGGIVGFIGGPGGSAIGLGLGALIGGAIAIRTSSNCN
jgi:bacteriocin-like protein